MSDAPQAPYEDGDSRPPTPAERALPDPDYDDLIERHEAQLAEQRQSAIEAGRRKAGLAGAAMAGAMLAVADIYEGPKKDDKPVTVEASSDPDDVDRDGIALAVGDVEVDAPPLPTLDPVVERANQRKRPQV
jgi:hypothetical protein